MFNWRLYRSYSNYLLIIGLLCGCTVKKERSETKTVPAAAIKIPQFNSDSAYFFIAKQVDFGPRIPNTVAHQQTGDYISATLKRYKADVLEQTFEATSYNGKKLFLRNIIASYDPEKQKRILLAAHWDTRPFADKDAENPRATFDGANDGASGVGVLLEVARLLGTTEKPKVGIDIVFFDGEDGGEPNGTVPSPPTAQWDSWWCLGSQYWAKNKHKADYMAYYGILLDMVGAKGLQFFREGLSLDYAPKITHKVWNMAAQLGYGGYFIKEDKPAIIDDHVYINKWAKIPTVNIVGYQVGVGYFGQYHHSRQDNMTIISKDMLEVVGKTIVHIIYHEKG